MAFWCLPVSYSTYVVLAYKQNHRLNVFSTINVENSRFSNVYMGNLVALVLTKLLIYNCICLVHNSWFLVAGLQHGKYGVLYSVILKSVVIVTMSFITCLLVYLKSSKTIVSSFLLVLAGNVGDFLWRIMPFFLLQ